VSDPLGGWLMPALIFALMFGMGLALTIDDFRRVLKLPGPVIVGTLLQLVAMPLVGYALAVGYGLPPLLSVGIVIAAACPGGMLSNMLVHWVGANTALSISLTATATAATLFTLPLWIRASLAHTGGAGGVAEIPLLETALELGSLTILPVVLGMATCTRFPGAARLDRPLTLLASLGILAALTLDGFMRPESPVEAVALVTPPALWLAGAALLLGLLVPMLLRFSASDTVTIAVEIGVKNTLLGIVVASSSFGVLEPSIPILLYGGLMLPLGASLVIGYRLHRRFRAARNS